MLVCWYGPRHPVFSTYIARLQSFDKNWLHPNHSAEAFSSAGFFYTGIHIFITAAKNGTHSTLHLHISIFHILTGRTDETRCFQCGGGLRGWQVKIRSVERACAHGSRIVFISVTSGKGTCNRLNKYVL